MAALGSGLHEILILQCKISIISFSTSIIRVISHVGPMGTDPFLKNIHAELVGSLKYWSTMSPDVVVVNLQRISDEVIKDERDVSEVGRLGFHSTLLAMCESCPNEEISALANELVARCVGMSSDGCFPMLTQPVLEYNTAFAGRSQPAYFSHDVGQGISLCVKSRAEKSALVENMLWPASLSLARWIVLNQDTIIPRAPKTGRSAKFRVLEIGAGLGAVGIAVCKLLESIHSNAKLAGLNPLVYESFVTDRNSRITSTILENIVLNSLDPKVQCIPCVLDWDILDSLPADKTLDHHDNLASYVQPNSVDLIVGSEVVHEDGHDNGVISAIKYYLRKTKDAQCYLMLSHEHHRYAVKELKEKLSMDPDLDYILYPTNFNDDNGSTGCYNRYELHRIAWNL